MNFTDVERDVHKLIGLELNSISRSAAITIENIDDEQERLIIRPKNGNSRSRPMDELKRIWDAMQKEPAVHVDKVLNGSGTSRNQPETILANLPYIEWLRIDNKKHIAYVMDAEKDIDQEIAEHKKRIQECDEESSRLAQLINQDLQPTIQELQNQIEMLQESVDSASQQGIIEKIEKHITTPKKTEDGNEDQAAFKAQDNFTAEFVSDFNDLLNTILTEVKFDKFSNCYFDFESEDFDIVVNGKKKQKFGGGYKAFLNATVAIALHQYLSEKGKHGLGILLMDSPILSLKEGGSDTSAEMRNGLFEYLVKNQDFGQVIIVENSIPTIDYDGAKREMYTHKEGDGRYGLLIGYTE